MEYMVDLIQLNHTFLLLYLFKSKLINFERLNKLRFLEFNSAVLIAFDEISIPIPLDKFKFF